MSQIWAQFYMQLIQDLSFTAMLLVSPGERSVGLGRLRRFSTQTALDAGLDFWYTVHFGEWNHRPLSTGMLLKYSTSVFLKIFRFKRTSRSDIGRPMTSPMKTQSPFYMKCSMTLSTSARHFRRRRNTPFCVRYAAYHYQLKYTVSCRSPWVNRRRWAIFPRRGLMAFSTRSKSPVETHSPTNTTRYDYHK